MNTGRETVDTAERKATLSALWIFLTFNYLYGDLAMMIFYPAIYQRAAAKMTEGVVLGAAVLMEIPMAMIFLSRILKYKANRWVNIIAGVVGTAFVLFTLFGGRAPALYVFLSVIEIGCGLFIIWYAWTWPGPQHDHKAERT